MGEPAVLVWAKTLTLKVLSFGLARLREWMSKKIYPDEQLRNHIQVRGKREPEVTLKLALSYGVPLLIIRLDIENFSPYFDAALERMVGSVDVVDFAYHNGDVFRGPSPHRVFIDVPLTSEQDKRMREIVDTKADAVIKGTLTIRVGGRSVRKWFEFGAKVYPPS